MPTTIASTFIELLIYTAPGIVVLYSLRDYFPLINNLLGQNGKYPDSFPSLVPMLLMAIATGIIIAGITSVITGFFNWLLYSRKDHLDERKRRMTQIFSHDAAKLSLVAQYYRNYEAYGRMTIALLISTLITLYNHFFVKAIDNAAPKLILLGSFLFFMILATWYSMRNVYRLLVALGAKLEDKK
jgi:dolichyl-phosphate-mannose--protein O-mannosyl transferase